MNDILSKIILTLGHSETNISLGAGYGLFDGQLQQIGNYTDGKKTGEWKYYDENGNLTETENH